MTSREMTVKGLGKVVSAPDLIEITIDLEAIDAQYEQAIVLAEQQIQKLKAAVTTSGHAQKDLLTTSFNVTTKYESFQDEKALWQNKFVGYSVTHSLRLAFDLDMVLLSKTVEAIAACDAKPRFNIRFTIKNQQHLQDALLADAIKNATQKAQVMATAAAVSLGEIIKIDYSFADKNLYSPTNMMVADAGVQYESRKMRSVDINPDDISVHDYVTVVWEINA